MKRLQLLDIKSLFENKLEETRREREMLVRSRIESFNNRHKLPGESGDSPLQADTKVRPLWGNQPDA